jgi:phosphoribosyl 1,2-cyclic phosphodiesterase
MDDVKIIYSGSTGNAVLYFGKVLVDCGVPFAKIKPFLDGVKLILISHEHGDHFNGKTLKKIQFEYPNIEIFNAAQRIQGSETSVRRFAIGNIKFAVFPLYHDVPNYGFCVEYMGKKVFHATDTACLDGITAKGYDYYCIEANYDEDVAKEVIAFKRSHSLFAHEIGSINSHLSIQQCESFFEANRGPESVLIKLHENKLFPAVSEKEII